MEKIIEETIEFYYSCCLPRPYITKLLPKLINREIKKGEWTEIFDFIYKHDSFKNCKDFSDRNCEGCEIKNSYEFPPEYFISRVEFWKFWEKKDMRPSDEST